MKIFPVLLLLLLALGSCKVNNQLPEGLAVGQSFMVSGDRLTFVQVIDDSRCCCECNCLWEGVATVLLQAPSEVITLHTTDSEVLSTTANYGNKTLRLVRLDPWPCGGEPDEQSDYRLTLRVD
jgi:hypothetical protein